MRKMTSVHSPKPTVHHIHHHHSSNDDVETSNLLKSTDALPEENHNHPHSSAYSNERWWKFVYLVGGIMFFFGCHNYMQELIMSLPGFRVSDA